MGQMDSEAVEAVRNSRAGRTSRRVVGPEHEVVDEKLRAPPEKLGERRVTFSGLEPVYLVDPDPWQRLALPRQFVAAPRQLLFPTQEFHARRQPFFARNHRMILRDLDFVIFHGMPPSFSVAHRSSDRHAGHGDGR
jgi:hypothetical protein